MEVGMLLRLVLMNFIVMESHLINVKGRESYFGYFDGKH